MGLPGLYMSASVCLKTGYANTRWLDYGDADEIMVSVIIMNTIHQSLFNKILFVESDTLPTFIDKNHWIVTSAWRCTRSL
jgi:hypothetical protein